MKQPRCYASILRGAGTGVLLTAVLIGSWHRATPAEPRLHLQSRPRVQQRDSAFDLFTSAMGAVEVIECGYGSSLLHRRPDGNDGLSGQVASSPEQANAPRVEFFQFDPQVIRTDRMEPLLFEAKVFGNPSRVVFELNSNPLPSQQPGTDIQMLDDGTGADRRPRDQVYSALLPPSQLVSGPRADDVFRPSVGFLKVFQGTTLVSRGNLFAEFITDEVPRSPVTRLADYVQYTDYLVNIVEPSFFMINERGVVFDATRLTNRFYQFFPDEYDSLNLIHVPSYPQNRVRVLLKNDVQGIGLQMFDSSAYYGSGGTLLGYSVFPNTVFFDGAESGYQHELGHQWINHLNVAPLDAGRPHWPLSCLASGIMGFSLPRGVGGRFPCRLVPQSGGVRLVPAKEEPVFTDLDLYLMGLLPAEQVGEHLVLADQNQARGGESGGSLSSRILERQRQALWCFYPRPGSD